MTLRQRIDACDRRLAAVARVVKASTSIPQIRKCARLMDRIETIRAALVERVEARCASAEQERMWRNGAAA